MKRTFTLALGLFLMANLAMAQLSISITDPATPPDPLEFCIGETITFQHTPYSGFGWVEWMYSPVEPDLINWMNSSEWVYATAYVESYTHTIEGEVWVWAREYNFGTYINTNVFHISSKGTIPQLSYTESDTAFCEGSNVSISANPDNLGSGNYIWYRDGNEIVGETGANLTFSLPGRYQVAAKDAASACPDIFVPGAEVAFSYLDAKLYGSFKADLNRVALSTDEIYSTYQWYSGADKTNLSAISGAVSASYNASISASDTYYCLEVSSAGGCTLFTDTILVNNLIYAEPVIATPSATFACSNESIILNVENDGFDNYQWYKDGSMIWGANASSLEVSTNWPTYGGGSFSVQIFAGIDEEAIESDAVLIEFASAPWLNMDETACPDSAVEIYIDKNSYESYQWYVNDVYDFSTAVLIDGANDTAYFAEVQNEARNYWLEVTLDGCTEVSSPINVFPYTLYAPSIFTLPDYLQEASICLGDSAELAGFGYDVDFHWYKDGTLYDTVSGSNAWVKETGLYTLKTVSTLCPGLEPVLSNDTIHITYTVSPTLLVDPVVEEYNGLANWYAFCAGEEITLTVENAENYENIQWINRVLEGFPWEDLEGDTLPDLQFLIGEPEGYHFKARVDSVLEDGSKCSGETRWVVIDQHVWLLPTTSITQSPELCEEGDSLLIEASSDTFVRYQWYRDSDPIPGAESRTYWIKEPGQYHVIAYPEACPDIGLSSGVGPSIVFMPDAVITETDTSLLADPWLFDNYSYKWYFNDVAINSDTLIEPSVIMKDQLKDGSYVVEVTNPENCVRISEAFIWESVGLEQAELYGIHVYPNPVVDKINVNFDDPHSIDRIDVYNLNGARIKSIEVIEELNIIPLDDVNSGAYFLKIRSLEQEIPAFTIIKR